MAGAVTTATLLAGVTYYLSTCPSSLIALQQELRSRFRTIDEITSKELLTCEYLNAVIEEGLRIFPPAGAGHLSRIVPEGGCMIEEVWVPGGVRTLLSNCHIDIVEIRFDRREYRSINGLFCVTKEISLS